MPEEPSNCIFEIRVPKNILSRTTIIALHAVFIKIGDIKFGSHFEKWPSPRYAQFLKFPLSKMLKLCVYITQINSQTFLSTKCLRAYRAGPGLMIIVVSDESRLQKRSDYCQ